MIDWFLIFKNKKLNIIIMEHLLMKLLKRKSFQNVGLVLMDLKKVQK